MQTNPQMQTPNLIYDVSPSQILVGGSCYNTMSDENRNVLGDSRTVYSNKVTGNGWHREILLCTVTPSDTPT